MKIGILTYHRAYNYGAFLQAYALKSFLEKTGNQVGFIDYWPYDHENMYRLWDKNDNIKSFFRNLLLAQKRFPRYKRFLKDQQQFLGVGSKPLFRTPEQLLELEYDIIIYGSDQIWWKSRIGNNGFDSVYWGQNTRKGIKKIAYAASMGIIDLTEKDTADITNYLKDFSQISVRETRLMTVLQPLTDKPIKTVLDPTLLMPSSFWESFCGNLKPVKGKYILYYRMMGDPKADVFAKEIGKLHDLPVITITGHIDSYKVDRFNSLTDPISFVALIHHAEYVISTSFHGVALSIQFKKEFYAMGMKNNSDRVSSLLLQLGLEKRLTDTIPVIPSQMIDYTLVHSKLKELQQESSDFLTSSLLL